MNYNHLSLGSAFSCQRSKKGGDTYGVKLNINAKYMEYFNNAFLKSNIKSFEKMLSVQMTLDFLPFTC